MGLTFFDARAPVASVEALLWEPAKTIWMRQGRIVVDRRFLSTRKKRMAVTQLASVAGDLGNAIFLYDATAAGPASSKEACHHRPVVAIAKTKPGQCGRLVPNSVEIMITFRPSLDLSVSCVRRLIIPRRDKKFLNFFCIFYIFIYFILIFSFSDFLFQLFIFKINKLTSFFLLHYLFTFCLLN